jgi:hypothetical protein
MLSANLLFQAPMGLLHVGMQAGVLCVDAVVAVLVAAGGSGNGPPQSTQCGELKCPGLWFVHLLQQRLGELSMKSFSLKLLAVAAASACGTAAMAGSLAVTPSKYAVEAITNSSAVTLPAAVLTIGVGRTVAQDFTVVIKPKAGSTFSAASCTTATPVFASSNGTATATATVKRASTSECAYEVDVTGSGFLAGDTTNLTFTGLVLASHGLATVGATETIAVGVWDLGETARIDNSADLTNTVGQTYQGVTMTATQDTGTVTNVDDTRGPLFGFVAANGDTADIAEANFALNINGSLLTNAGVQFTNAALTNVTFTITGDFDGVSTNFAGQSNASVNAAAMTVTTAGTGASATASFTASSAQLNATGATNGNVGLKTLGTKSLGTSRTFGISASVNPALAGVPDMTVTGNASWWVWGANAMELRSAFFNNDTTNGNITRFFFQNTGADASYTATCYSDDAAKTVTYGTAKTGTLRTGQTTLTAADVCTFSAGQRGAITFTINGPAANVKGVYQQAINGVTAGYLALERPYANKTY